LIRENTWHYQLAPLGYALAFIVALWSPRGGLVIVGVVSLYYLIPLQVMRFG
jgi:hypothetical protein